MREPWGRPHKRPGDLATNEIDCGPGRDEVRTDGDYEKRSRRCEFRVIGMG